jgi:hypothetical protein
MTHEPTSLTPSRRRVLQTATAGAAAAFLAACTKARKEATPKPGQSGTPAETTLVAPTVPTTEPSAEALEEDITLLRTGTSLELLAAEVYGELGPKLKDADWKAAAARFQADHQAAAEVFNHDTPPAKQIDKPNEYMQTEVVDPVMNDLKSSRDGDILDFFRTLESTLTATYVTAAGTFTSADWRYRVMTLGSASARRVGVLANQGTGGTVSGGLYPVTDLISNDAYVEANPKKKAAG